MENSALACILQKAINDAQIQLLSADVKFEWLEKDGRKVPTETVKGISYLCLVKAYRHEKIIVATTEKSPVICNDEIYNSDRDIYVNFEGLCAKVFVKNNAIITVFTAKRAFIKPGVGNTPTSAPSKH